jgi:hypothetical protein
MTTRLEALERRVIVIPAYDHQGRNGKGKGSMKITFAVIGRAGATSFTADLGIHLDQTCNHPAEGTDISTHYRFASGLPGPKDDYIHCEECALTPDGEGCYLQTSSLLAKPFWHALVRGGHEALFDLLEDLHRLDLGGDTYGR